MSCQPMLPICRAMATSAPAARSERSGCDSKAPEGACSPLKRACVLSQGLEPLAWTAEQAALP